MCGVNVSITAEIWWDSAAQGAWPALVSWGLFSTLERWLRFFSFCYIHVFLDSGRFFLICIYLCFCLEKAMAPHSSTLAWKFPWMEEPGRLQSMGLLRVRHDWATSLSLFTFHALEKEMATHSSVLAWRIPGRGSLVGCHLWGHTESDTTEVT